jgi:hypothetical protein
MEYTKASEYAKLNATNDFGSDIMKRINDKFVSSATGKLSYMKYFIQALTDFFETQKLAYDNGQENWFDEFHNHVQETLEGNGADIQGLKKQLTMYFWNQEFKREPDKKRAIALYLKYYVQYIKDNVSVVTAVEFLNLPINKNYNGNYFNKDYVFGELLNIIEKQLNE